jgi:hypothetical protein
MQVLVDLVPGIDDLMRGEMHYCPCVDIMVAGSPIRVDLTILKAEFEKLQAEIHRMNEAADDARWDREEAAARHEL